MLLLADRASRGWIDTCAVLEFETALQTLGGNHGKSLSTGLYALFQVIDMIVDILFSHAQDLRKSYGGHLSFSQQFNHLLSYRSQGLGIPLFLHCNFDGLDVL